jgi:DNA-binding transcriptional ArsR family regulator
MPARRATKKPDDIASQLAELARRVAALEATKGTKSKRAPTTTHDSDDLLQLLERRRAAAPKDRHGRGGVVTYGGSLSLGAAEYLWAIERPLDGVLATELEAAAHVLAMLANPQRLRILVALVEQPRTAAELQKVIASKSPGPLYHHLRDLLALGVVAQHERRYVIPARHVVPLLTALTLTVDLAARREG